MKETNNVHTFFHGGKLISKSLLNLKFFTLKSQNKTNHSVLLNRLLTDRNVLNVSVCIYCNKTGMAKHIGSVDSINHLAPIYCIYPPNLHLALSVCSGGCLPFTSLFVKS